jgi:hypothetical protein
VDAKNRNFFDEGAPDDGANYSIKSGTIAARCQDPQIVFHCNQLSTYFTQQLP